MRWLNILFHPATWFYWTVPGRAVRNALNDLPNETHYREVEPNRGKLDQLTDELRKLVAASDAPEPPASSSPDNVHPHDEFDEPIRLLSEILEDRQIRLDRLTRENKAELVKVLVDLQSNKSDGKNPRLSFVESNIVSLAENDIDRFVEKNWARRRQKWEGKAHRLQHELRDLLNQFQELTDVHREEGFRHPHRMFAPWLYWIILAIVGLAELPMNLTAFRILGEVDWIVFLIALGPSIVIPYLSHVIGTSIRQWSERESLWRGLVIGAIASASLVVGVASIGYLRASWLALDLATGEHRPIDFQQALAVLGVNLLFLSMGVVAAYFAHDPDRELERVFEERKRLRHVLTKKWNEWNKVATTYDEYLANTIARVGVLRSAAAEKIDEYRVHNAEVRRDGKVPTWFSAPVGDHLFKPRYFGQELDRPPETLEVVLREIEDDGREDRGKANATVALGKVTNASAS